MELGPHENQSSHKIASGVLVVLVLVALVLSYYLYQTVMNGSARNGSILEEQTPVADGTLPPLSDAEIQALQTPLTVAVASPTGMDLFGNPVTPPKIPEGSEGMSYTEAAFENIAVVAETVTMGKECRVSPVVLKVKKGASVAFKNIDTVPHEVIFSQQRSFTVGVGSSISVPIDFGTVGMTYGYGCESQPSAIGLMWIAE